MQIHDYIITLRPEGGCSKFMWGESFNRHCLSRDANTIYAIGRVGKYQGSVFVFECSRGKALSIHILGQESRCIYLDELKLEFVDCYQEVVRGFLSQVERKNDD